MYSDRTEFHRRPKPTASLLFRLQIILYFEKRPKISLFMGWRSVLENEHNVKEVRYNESSRFVILKNFKVEQLQKALGALS